MMSCDRSFSKIGHSFSFIHYTVVSLKNTILTYHILIVTYNAVYYLPLSVCLCTCWFLFVFVLVLLLFLNFTNLQSWKKCVTWNTWVHITIKACIVFHRYGNGMFSVSIEWRDIAMIYSSPSPTFNVVLLWHAPVDIYSVDLEIWSKNITELV